MRDFNSYIEDAVGIVTRKHRAEVPSGERGIIPEAYYTGYIYGLRQAKKLFETYEQHAMGEGKED